MKNYEKWILEGWGSLVHNYNTFEGKMHGFLLRTFGGRQDSEEIPEKTQADPCGEWMGCLGNDDLQVRLPLEGKLSPKVTDEVSPKRNGSYINRKQVL